MAMRCHVSRIVEKTSVVRMHRRALKDARKRACFAKWEPTRMLLRAIVADRTVDDMVRFRASLLLNACPRHSTPVRIHNRCVQTGRAKGVYRRFKLSRIRLRELMGMGAIPGMKKASW